MSISTITANSKESFKPQKDNDPIIFEGSLSSANIISEEQLANRRPEQTDLRAISPANSEAKKEEETELTSIYPVTETKRNVASRLSRVLTRRFFLSATDPSVASYQGLDRLKSEEYLFIKHAGNEFDNDYIDLSHIYDIVNSNGERIFSAVKTFQYENCDRLLQLDVCILECEGGGVLSVKGDSATISVCTLTFSGELLNELGQIFNRKDGGCSEQELEVEMMGKRQFHLTQHKGRLHKRRGDFDIVWSEGSVACGRTSYDWTNWFDASSPLVHSNYGVGFSKNMDVDYKAILLATMIFLYFENFDSSGNLRRGSFTFDRICCLIFGILFVLIMILLMTTAILRAVYSEF